MGDEQDVRAAVAGIIAAFGEERMDDYFARFTPDCSFLFHTTARRMPSVQAYRDEYARWVAEDGFRIRSCETTDTEVQLHGDVAVVTHHVVTHVEVGGRPQVLDERETIVLRKVDGRWMGVHEHLSESP
ncbi:MAG: YybH family protein [Actinomycetota bacterium]